MEYALEVRAVSLRFGGVRALADVSFGVKAGELFSIIGPNGAGKTSIVNCISGRYRPTEGLAPLIVQQVGDLIAEIARRGLAILLVEQKLSIAMRISHRVYVMGHGRIVFEGTPAELNANAAVRKEWLEV